MLWFFRVKAIEADAAERVFHHVKKIYTRRFDARLMSSAVYVWVG